MSELNASYSNSVPVPDTKWGKSKICVIRRFQDDQWYRAEVLEVSNEEKLVKASVEIIFLHSNVNALCLFSYWIQTLLASVLTSPAS